jgi:carbon-monoxide dehydrogenase large subunit
MADVRITTPSEISGMGHRMKRKEDPRFLQGAGHYVDDVKLPGMLYLDIVRSPYAHARILKIDASKALALPGVVAVITGEDLKKAGNLHWMPTLMSDTQMVLPIDKVVYYAQEVCAVVATERYIAADGVELVEVEYDPLPTVVDPYEALKDESSATTRKRRPTTSGIGRRATKPPPAKCSRKRRASSRNTSTSRVSTSPRLKRAAWSPIGTRSTAT